MQEIGKAVRDGLPSEACLFYNKNDIGRNLTNQTTEMRSFCTLDTCRRVGWLVVLGLTAL